MKVSLMGLSSASPRPATSSRMRTVCKFATPCYMRTVLSREETEPPVYVCNCNGIRERQARAAIEQGATRPADIFRHCQARPCCAKCVCDMQRMIQETQEVLALAAE